MVLFNQLGFKGIFTVTWSASSAVERRFDGKLRQHPGKLVKVSFSFKTFIQFCRKGFKFLFVYNLPISVVGMNISKTGNYTILITFSQ